MAHQRSQSVSGWGHTPPAWGYTERIDYAERLAIKCSSAAVQQCKRVVSLNCRDELGWFLSVVAFSMMSHSFLKKCEMDWESLSCPNRRCRYYGRPFLQGQLVSNKLSAGHAKRM